MKMTRKTKRIGKAAVIAGALAAIMAVGGASAYFTATDNKDNTWTVGNVNIELQETGYDAAQDERTNITPNMELTKDPQILNDGTNDAFVFMRVQVPKANVKVATQDNTSFTEEVQELFDYTFDDGWTVIDTKEGTDSNTYVCVYGSATKCQALAKDATTPTLFKDGKITFKNVLEGQGLDGTTLEMPVEAFAIQTADITESDTDVPSEVWSVLDAR